ncbi:MAG TPA: hypothetical protein VG796_04590 [Verrucomicrobiales bacterium]|nr:hypothetical protein [Verrucomicrobiales bacterium]
MKTSAKFLFLLGLMPFLAASAQEPEPSSQAVQGSGFEDPPTLRASEILRPEYLSGQGWKVNEEVPTWAGRNSYLIETEFGNFEVEGNALLARRIREVAAIRELRGISKSDEYKAALKAAAKSPLVAARGLIENPVKTVTGIPKGIFKMVGRAGNSIKNAAQGREKNPYEDSTTKQMIGFSKAKRELASKLGVDPYSSNPVLQKELNGHAWTTFAGSATFRIATLPAGGDIANVLTAARVTTNFNAVLRDKSPADLRIMNEGILKSLGCDTALAENFLGNPAFSPSAQTAFVMNLNELKGVKSVFVLVDLANQQSDDEADALFFVETSRILAHVHANDTPLHAVGAFDVLPVTWTKDGRLVLALEWDYASWTERAADFVTRFKEAKIPGFTGKGHVIALSGFASPRAAEGVKKAGISLTTGLDPGPLK